MPRPDGRYSMVEVDHETLSEAQTVATFQPSVRVPWVVVTTLTTAFASVIGTYYATRGAPVDCASRADLNALSQSVGQLRTDVTALTDTVNRNADNSNNHLEIELQKLRTDVLGRK